MATEERPKKGDAILFFDVESLPVERDDPLWGHLSSQIETRPEETPEGRLLRIESLRRETALNAPLGRAWMIGYALGARDPTLLISDGSNDGEKKLLLDFYQGIGELVNPWFVGHNISGYDIPFLQVRALRHGLPDLAQKLGRTRIKPWDSRVLDTQKIWPRTGADRNSWKDGLMGLGRLDTICAVLGIPQQIGVMGPDVYSSFLAGDTKGVADHLDADVRQVREVFKRIWPIL